jgi:hypothetical protein
MQLGSTDDGKKEFQFAGPFLACKGGPSAPHQFGRILDANLQNAWPPFPVNPIAGDRRWQPKQLGAAIQLSELLELLVLLDHILTE